MWKKRTARLGVFITSVISTLALDVPVQASPRDDALAAIQAARVQANANGAYLSPEALTAYNQAFTAWTAAVYQRSPIAVIDF